MTLRESMIIEVMHPVLLELRRWYVYALLDPRDYGPRWIGVSTQPEVRLTTHMYDGVHTRKGSWLHELRSIGLTPILVILQEFAEKKAAEAVGRILIARFGETLVNTAENPHALASLSSKSFPPQRPKEGDEES